MSFFGKPYLAHLVFHGRMLLWKDGLALLMKRIIGPFLVKIIWVKFRANLLLFRLYLVFQGHKMISNGRKLLSLFPFGMIKLPNIQLRENFWGEDKMRTLIILDIGWEI